jgi:hypothetical protein
VRVSASDALSKRSEDSEIIPDSLAIESRNSNPFMNVGMWLSRAKMTTQLNTMSGHRITGLSASIPRTKT